MNTGSAQKADGKLEGTVLSIHLLIFFQLRLLSGAFLIENFSTYLQLILLFSPLVALI